MISTPSCLHFELKCCVKQPHYPPPNKLRRESSLVLQHLPFIPGKPVTPVFQLQCDEDPTTTRMRRPAPYCHDVKEHMRILCQGTRKNEVGRALENTMESSHREAAFDRGPYLTRVMERRTGRRRVYHPPKSRSI